MVLMVTTLAMTWMALIPQEANNRVDSALKHIWWNGEAGQEIGVTAEMRAKMDELLVSALRESSELSQQVRTLKQSVSQHLASGDFEKARTEIHQQAQLLSAIQVCRENLKLNCIQLLSPDARALMSEKYGHLFTQNWFVASRPSRNRAHKRQDR